MGVVKILFYIFVYKNFVFMKGIIYRATCQMSGRVYIGQTVGSLAKRRGRHLADSRGADVENEFHYHLAMWPDLF